MIEIDYLYSIGFVDNFKFKYIMDSYIRETNMGTETVTYLPDTGRFEAHGIMTGTSATTFVDVLQHIYSSEKEFKLWKRSRTIKSVLSNG